MHAPGERLNVKFAVADRHRVAGRHRFDALGREADVQQGHALAGGGEQRPFHGVAQRLDAQRIAGDHHVTQGVEKHQTVRAVELPCAVAANVDQLRPPLRSQRPADLMHQHFRVRLVGQMVVVIVEQLLAEVHVVGQLPIEGETEPLVLLDMLPLEGLGAAAIVGAAGGVADVADGGPARVFLHQALVLAAMVEPKNLADIPQFLVGVD